jgi:hypothetical protein
MSKYVSIEQTKARNAFTGFLIIAGFAFFVFGAAFVLAVEPRMTFERSGEGVFRVTGQNFFAGRQIYSKTIEGVTGVSVGSAARNDRNESIEDRNRRQKHLNIVGANGARLGWGRESDQGAIEEFMRGREPRLVLEDKPPLWRRALTWFGFVLGGLILWGGVKAAYFTKSGLP